MKRISTAHRQLDKFGAGKDGFKDGTPPGAVPTRLEADWCDGLQEELAKVIEAAGLTLSGADYTQLYQAIQILILGGDTSVTDLIEAAGVTLRHETGTQRIAGALGASWRKVSTFVNPTGLAVDDGYDSNLASLLNNVPHSPAIAAVQTDSFHTGNATTGISSVGSVTGNLRAVAIRKGFEAIAVGDAGASWSDLFLNGAHSLDGNASAIPDAPNLDEIIYDKYNDVYWATGNDGIYILASPFDLSTWSRVTNVGYKYPVATPSNRVYFVRRDNGKIRFVNSALDLTFHEGPAQDEAYVCPPVYDEVIGAAVYCSNTSVYKLVETPSLTRSVLATMPADGNKALVKLRGRACIRQQLVRNFAAEHVFAVHTGTGAAWIVSNPQTLFNTAGTKVAGCNEQVVMSNGSDGLYVSERLIA